MSSTHIGGAVNPDGSIAVDAAAFAGIIATAESRARDLATVADDLFVLIDCIEALAVGLPVAERTCLLTAACDIKSAAVRCYGVSESVGER